jgi:hypothetical protein
MSRAITMAATTNAIAVNKTTKNKDKFILLK